MCQAPTPISHTRGRAGCPADFLMPQSDAEDDFSLSLSALTFSPRWAASETRNYLPAARPRGISSPDSQPRPNGGQIRAGLRGRASHPRVPIPNTSRRVACVGTHPKSLPNCRSAVAPRPDPMDGMAAPHRVRSTFPQRLTEATEEKEAGRSRRAGLGCRAAPRLTHPRGCLGAEVDVSDAVAVLFSLSCS